MRPNTNLLRLARPTGRCSLPPRTGCLVRGRSSRVAKLSTSSAVWLDSQAVDPFNWPAQKEERNSEATASAVGNGLSQKQTDDEVKQSPEAGEVPVLSLFTKGTEPTTTIHVYFPGNRRDVTLVFDNKTSAEKAKGDFDAGVCKIHGREVPTTVVERDQNGQSAWELVLRSIPAETLQQDISASFHRVHQPIAVLMGEPYNDAEGETYTHIQDALSQIGPFRSRILKPHNDPWADGKAVFTFTSTAHAEAAVEALRNKPMTIGNRDIEITAKRLYCLQFRIPAALDSDVGRHIEQKFDTTWRKQNLQYQWLKSQGSRTLKLYREDVSILQSIEDEMAALVDGAVVKTSYDQPLWIEEFDHQKTQVTRQPVLMKLKMIEQALGVKFLRDQAAHRLIIFGPELQRKLACELARKAAMVNHRAVDPRSAHHWQRLDLQEFKHTVQQYFRSQEDTPEQTASSKTEKPLFRKVINVPSHVACSSQEDLERLQRATGRDPRRPLGLSSVVPSTEGQEPPIFRKHVPKLSDYAKAFLDARLNPRFVVSDKSRSPEEAPVQQEQASHPQPQTSEHVPNPEGLKKLDELLNAMRSSPADSSRS